MAKKRSFNLVFSKMNLEVKMPYEKGSYALVLKLSREYAISIGRYGQLGTYDFPKGTYIYCGTAYGSGGLHGRMMNHMRFLGNSSTRPQWHIDSILSVANLDRVFYTLSKTRMECIWSKGLANLPKAFIPVPYFGASDCKNGCPAHLIGFPTRYPSESWRTVFLSSGVDVVELEFDYRMSYSS